MSECNRKTCKLWGDPIPHVEINPPEPAVPAPSMSTTPPAMVTCVCGVTFSYSYGESEMMIVHANCPKQRFINDSCPRCGNKSSHYHFCKGVEPAAAPEATRELTRFEEWCADRGIEPTLGRVYEFWRSIPASLSGSAPEATAREQFEDWIGTRTSIHLYRRGSKYAYEAIQDMWEAWQAGRASLSGSARHTKVAQDKCELCGRSVEAGDCDALMKLDTGRSMLESLGFAREQTDKNTWQWRNKLAEGDAGTQPSVQSALWLCYHALKQSEWDGKHVELHCCPYCNYPDTGNGHAKDCMIGNGLKAMSEAVSGDKEKQ